MDFLLEPNKILLVLSVTLAVIWVISKWLEYRKLPPGPFGFPLIGYFPFLQNDTHKVFVELSKKYGNIFSVNAGTSTIVVINDYETAKTVLNNPATFGRPDQFSRLFPGKAGFGTSTGYAWQEQRRFCVMVMKNLGMGRGEWERMIHDETIDFMEEIKSWKGKPTDFEDSLTCSQTGNNFSLLIGRRLSKDKNNEETKIIMTFIQLIMTAAAASSIFVNMPYFVLKLFSWLSIGNIKAVSKSAADFEALLRKEININRTTSNSKEKPNFIKYYLEEQEKQEKSGKEHHFSMENLIGNMTSLVLGGVDTTKLSLQWLLLILASHPDIQEKIHQEIDNVAGKDRQIYWDERNQFPYVMATINEMERWVVITPVYPPRWALEEMKIDNYTIPKRAVILVNEWNIMRNHKNHRNADDFDPERFLNEEQNHVQKMDTFIPFSMGKRNCPGEQIAMMTIFLYITAIMQKFRVVCPDGKTVTLEDRGKGLTRHAVSQELCFIER